MEMSDCEKGYHSGTRQARSRQKVPGQNGFPVHEEGRSFLPERVLGGKNKARTGEAARPPHPG
ncbi:hypothetical protein NITGR_1010040 [Nitrospina gracilis 3/211]|uniref:Uncharacterized protein n=1 Tax=Nitrospina gracilis (strain 3/211) TaxID=1266370 RepID=M1YVI8_NITG3|nr:hypothetical protein NITGR_1010040 [Nitrospina gracilis 3/211]